MHVPAQQVVVVRSPWISIDDVPSLTSDGTLVVVALDDLGGMPQTVDAVVLVVRDRLDLRRVVAAVRDLPTVPMVGCVVVAPLREPPLLVPRPEWPPLRSLHAQMLPVCSVLAEFERPVRAGSVLGELARRATPAHLMSQGWPVLGLRRDQPHHWTSGDPVALLASDEEVHSLEGDSPPDVVLLDEVGPGNSPRSSSTHHVLGPVVDDLALGSPLTWAAYDEAAGRPVRLDPLGLGAVDEQLLNPIGFRRAAPHPVQPLLPVSGPGPLCAVATEDGQVVLDTRAGVGEAQVPLLRRLRGVRLEWTGGEGPHAYCRTVVGLAMAGIPLVSGPVPAWARALMHPELVATLTEQVDLSDELSREVHSIRLRRVTHWQHSGPAWRRLVAASRGLQSAVPGRVSVLLTTRRPEMLPFALHQVARQRGVDLEVVLATHGHDADRALVNAAAERSGFHIESFSVAEEVPFGAVLNESARRATGDVLLKMDDDDWYGPDFVSDLLMARRYSGGDVVGTPPEFSFVEPLSVTVRRKDATEVYTSVVAGGTLMIAPDTLAAVGGFRNTRRHVDAQLLSAVRLAGGTIYRTHGHGYVLRRGASGHTWDPGLGYFVSRSKTMHQWRGFRPSPLLEDEETGT
jgi:hypothetical protein